MNGAAGVMSVLPPGYPHDLERDIIDDRGFVYHLRPIQPDDAERLIAFHATLSIRSTYLRYFRVHPELSADELERFTHVDYRDRLALVVERDGILLAVGRFDRKRGTAEAEVAFVVADEYQHHGLGTLLLDELAAAARTRGFTSFVAETLAENRGMIQLFSGSGFPVRSERDHDTVSLRFPIEATEEYRRRLAAREARRAGAVASSATPGEDGTC